MSWLSKATGIHVNLKPLAPIIGGAVGSIIPGVGTALGAGLGSFLNGVGNGQGVGKSALAGLASGAGGAALASKIPGVSAVGDALGGVKNAVQGIPGIQGIESSLGGLAGKAGDFLTGNGGANALGAAEGINAALLGKQSSNYAKDALGSVTNSYNQRTPLRTAGQAGMLHPQIPDLAPLGAIAGNNPYARKITPVGGV